MNPLLSSLKQQASFKSETPRLELKSWRTFLAIKCCQQTKIRKVIKLAWCSKKSGRRYATIAVKLLTCYHLDGGAYYWQQLGMFGLLMNILSPCCLQRILFIVTVILFDSSSSMTWLIHDYRVVTLLVEHTIDNNLACLVYWWTCCNFTCRAYYSFAW